MAERVTVKTDDGWTNLGHGLRAVGCRFAGLEFCWWGWSQWYKWRWNGTHIDMGPLSIYGIKRPWLWLPLALAILPLRWWYHRRFR